MMVTLKVLDAVKAATINTNNSSLLPLPILPGKIPIPFLLERRKLSTTIFKAELKHNINE